MVSFAMQQMKGAGDDVSSHSFCGAPADAHFDQKSLPVGSFQLALSFSRKFAMLAPA